MITFTVRGLPAPQGSKRAIRNRHTGRVALVESSKRVAPWRADVRAAALAAMGDRLPLFGPLTVSLTFALPRPKGHYGSGRNVAVVRPSAPSYPAGKPDLDKLVRSTLDALTGVVFADDAQVVEVTARKLYGSIGAIVAVWEAA